MMALLLQCLAVVMNACAFSPELEAPPPKLETITIEIPAAALMGSDWPEPPAAGSTQKSQAAWQETRIFPAFQDNYCKLDRIGFKGLKRHVMPNWQLYCVAPVDEPTTGGPTPLNND